MRGPVVIAGDNLPSLVQIGLTDLTNIGGASGPPGPPGSGTTDNSNFQGNQTQKYSWISDNNKWTKIVMLKPKIQKKTPSYWIFQLQISQLCNETTHDKVAPTKQNLICRGKSAIEIIKMRGEPQSNLLRTPGKVFFPTYHKFFG